MTGAVSHHAGRVAEEAIATHYARLGAEILERRWRGSPGGGEIDLIVRDGDTVVFVEVKRAATHAGAAHRISRTQIERIHTAAGEFADALPDGLNTPMRFDAALVDDLGRIEVRENAFM